MYTEEYEAKGFVLRNFLLKLIVVIIFVSLLIWLIPKFSSPKIENNNKTDLSPIQSKIFAENMQKMQNVAIDYYTEARLPKKEGKSTKLTLSSMIKKKLLVPLVDQNDRACDINKSYVKVTKMDKEYLMKVNLKCSSEEDYILVHMGDYHYCDSAVCEKEEVKIEEEKSKPKETVSFGSKKTSVTSKKKQITSITGESLPDVIDSLTEESVILIPTKVAGFQYEYQKTTGAKYGEWSKWTNWQRTDCKTTAYNCNDNSPTCTQKKQIYKRKEQIGTYNKEYVASHREIRQTGSYEATTCANYYYISYNNETYALTMDYQGIDSVTGATQRSITGWNYNGRKSYQVAPQDTMTKRYKFVSADFSTCGSTCSIPKYWYDEYTYTGSFGKVSSLQKSEKTKNLKVNCVGTTRRIVPIYSNITVYDKAVRKEPLYGTVCYQSTKSRRVINAGKTNTKWSSYQDDGLLKNGYHYTGNSKQV